MNRHTLSLLPHTLQPVAAGAIGLALFCTVALGPAQQTTDSPEVFSPATPAQTSPQEGAVDLKRFAGRWIVADGEPGAPPGTNLIILRSSGGRVIGVAGKNRDLIDLAPVGTAKLKGTVTDARGQETPLTARLTADGDQLTLELAPPASEFVAVVATRERNEEASPVQTRAQVEKEFKEAEKQYKSLVEQDADRSEIAKARTAYQEARSKLRSLQGNDAPRSAVPTEPVTPSAPVETAKPEPPSSGSVQTEDDAVRRVSQLPEVASWLKKIDATRGSDSPRTAGFEVLPERNRYVIKVYENVPGDEGGHTAAFGWFAVDKRTGKASNIDREIIDGTSPAP